MRSLVFLLLATASLAAATSPWIELAPIENAATQQGVPRTTTSALCSPAELHVVAASEAQAHDLEGLFWLAGAREGTRLFVTWPVGEGVVAPPQPTVAWAAALLAC